MIPDYPASRTQLQKELARLRAEMPDLMNGFGQLHGAAMGEGALTAKHKELIALGIAIALRCDPCIAFHVREALADGATRGEIDECIAVAVMMGGGPALMYGAQAHAALEQFLDQK